MRFHGIDVPDDEIADFCRRWKVRQLALFGSVLREDFQSDSDVDVLVTFVPGANISLFDLGAMQQELEAMFGRHVDLVEEAGLRNPFRRRSILKNREIVYAA
ncbi:MAG: nucleotidyltransferase domain-containing protein [Armatimonadetes bacterium]|nr:nucleotidyltransferase domain-containing protein [Armatimonadota bacterium]